MILQPGSVYEAKEAYDKLLNKYSILLLNHLKPEDREVMKISQRNWLKFRDSEQEFSSLLMKARNVRGTVQRIVDADNEMERLRKRVFELYDYLTRIESEEELGE